jgi:hypothetical protein
MERRLLELKIEVVNLGGPDDLDRLARRALDGD